MKRPAVELGLYVVLMFAIPATQVVPGFGAVGTPATLLGLGLLVMLGLDRLRPGRTSAVVAGYWSRNPVIVGLAIYLAIIIASWSFGNIRPLSPLAASSSDRALLGALSLAGVALFVADRVRSWDAVTRLVDYVLVGGAFMCAIGMVQFFAGYDATRLLVVPGLDGGTQYQAVGTRSIFNRPHGTALHSIEFGVVAAALVPLALWRARSGGGLWRWMILVAVALSALLSVGRSGVLVLGVVGIVMLIGSGWRERLNLVAGGMVLVVASGALIPGLIGTIQSLFVNSRYDPSYQARIERIPEVLRLMAEYPWFGRGFGTFTIEEYLLLDNEIQKMGIETGVIGVAAFVAFFVTVVWAASVLKQRSELMGSLAFALAASIIGILVSYYTFDAFFYRILTGTLYIFVGLVAALWNGIAGRWIPPAPSAATTTGAVSASGACADDVVGHSRPAVMRGTDGRLAGEQVR